MVNGKDISSPLVIPVAVNTEKNCHRFFAPVVFPEPDKLNPHQVSVTPRLGNFNCIKERCMLWNAEKSECWDVSAARGQALAGEYAYAKLNDVDLGGQNG